MENEQQKNNVYAGSNGHERLLRKRLKYNYEKWGIIHNLKERDKASIQA